MPKGMLSAAAIKARAAELGFDLCGIAPASDHQELRFFREWLGKGYAGDMAYLNRSAERRADVRNVIPSARTVIVTATIYNTNRPYSTECKDPGRAHIARYAWGDDYHDVLGERMAQLLDWMKTASPEPFDARAYVDTGPVQERVYAQYAGIGWIGKNTCVINPEKGSWIFLAEIICSLDLECDRPAFDQCGTCTLCIEACPTKAIVGPGVLDSTRCISYLTIEHRGDIPVEFREAMGTHVYGCDICQEVCPWNATPPVSDDPAWQPRPDWDGATVVQLSTKSDEELRRGLRGSAMRRTKVAGLRRNLGAALLCGGLMLAAPAASAGETFEVASIKPHAPADTRQSGFAPVAPGGRVTIVGLTVRELTRMAWSTEAALLPSQITGGPEWVDSMRFDITAIGGDRLSSRTAAPGLLVAMLRALLEERFKMKMHVEQRTMPIYALVVDRADRALGSKLRPAAGDCTPPGVAGALVASLVCGFRRFGPTGMSAQGITLELLAGVLASQPDVQRVVRDRTNLTGRFDMDLEFTPMTPTAGAEAGPSLFTALKEQLGLRLDSERGPVDVRVIDAVEMPTGN